MRKINNDSSLSSPPPRKYKFYLGSRERYITISCDFDSGNIQLVKQLSQFQYRLKCVYDGTRTGHQVNSKSWFYFSVVGFPKSTKGKFIINKIQTLSSIYQSKNVKSFKPVFRSGQNGKWERINTEVTLVQRQNQLECIFQYQFKDENEKVYFAFSYPYTYTESIKYLNNLSDFVCIDDFYFYKEILVKSPQGRDIHLLTITSHDHQDNQRQSQQIFNLNLFPEKTRPKRFIKPVVLVSARVHPGQSSSSYAMKGLISFLTSKVDLRANLLRKMFVFMIVPMINVDGVFHGHFRMDAQGKNLNRYYLNPTLEKQPAIYAIKQLANHLNSENRLSFYFDLHAHNAKKGHFIYGNAINDFVQQVESQVFCKIVSLNNKGFEYKYCNFTQKQMNSKDRHENLTKEGCGRVVMHRLAKIIHSYSVQCGIVSPNTQNDIPNPPNTDFSLGNLKFQMDPLQDNKNPIYKPLNEENTLFTCQMYENLGKNLMVSILDVFDKNPYNRVYSSSYKSMDMLRRLTAFQIFHQDQRFRMFERFIFGKVRNINDLIKQVLNEKLHYKKLYNFYFYNDQQLKKVIWPSTISGLCKPKAVSPTKIRKYNKNAEIYSSTEAQSNYSNSFRQILASQKEPEEKIIVQNIEVQQYSIKSSETEDYENGQQFEEFQREKYEKQKDDISIMNEIQSKRQSILGQMRKYDDYQSHYLEPVSSRVQNSEEQKLNMNMNMKNSLDFKEFKIRSKSIKQNYKMKNTTDSNNMTNNIKDNNKVGLNINTIAQLDWFNGQKLEQSNVHEKIKEQIKKRVRKQLLNGRKYLKIEVQQKMKGNFRLNHPFRQNRDRIRSEINEKVQRYVDKSAKRQFPFVSSQHFHPLTSKISTEKN